jgi:hypothetical protein
MFEFYVFIYDNQRPEQSFKELILWHDLKGPSFLEAAIELNIDPSFIYSIQRSQ